MKKFTLLFFVTLLFLSGVNAQLVQGTIVPGSTPNSVYLQIKSNTTFTGFLGVQFAIAFPTSEPNLPTMATATTTIPGFNPTLIFNTYTTQAGYRIFTFDPVSTQPMGGSTTFTAGVTYTIAEITFTGGGFTTAPPSTALLQLPNGGTPPDDVVYFVVKNNGVDITNKPAQFFSVTGGTVVNSGVNDYSALAYVTLGSGVLPIRLSSFNTIKKDDNILVTWRVENQDANADRFIVERSSNGINFTAIGTIPVKVNGGNIIDYSYTDLNINGIRNNGVIYYRLRSVDKGGSFVNSEIKNVRLSNKAVVMSLYPNPAPVFTTVTLDLPEASPVIINVTDATGKNIKTIQMAGVKGINQKRIDLSAFSSGIYLFRILAAGGIETLPLVK